MTKYPVSQNALTANGNHEPEFRKMPGPVASHTPYPAIPNRVAHHIRAAVFFEALASKFHPACRKAAAIIRMKARNGKSLTS